jgi:hypothetical protein
VFERRDGVARGDELGQRRRHRAGLLSEPVGPAGLPRKGDVRSFSRPRARAVMASRGPALAPPAWIMRGCCAECELARYRGQQVADQSSRSQPRRADAAAGAARMTGRPQAGFLQLLRRRGAESELVGRRRRAAARAACRTSCSTRTRPRALEPALAPGPPLAGAFVACRGTKSDELPGLCAGARRCTADRWAGVRFVCGRGCCVGRRRGRPGHRAAGGRVGDVGPGGADPCRAATAGVVAGAVDRAGRSARARHRCQIMAGRPRIPPSPIDVHTLPMPDARSGRVSR